MKRFILIFSLILFLFCACGKEDNLSPYVSETALQTQQASEGEKETTEKLKAENYVSAPTEVTAVQPENTQKGSSLFAASWLSYMELSLVSG